MLGGDQERAGGSEWQCKCIHCIHLQKLQKKSKKKVREPGEMSQRGNHWSHKLKSQVLFL